MKRLFFVIAIFIACCISAQAEKISVDQIKDGYRFVQTERSPHVFLVNGTMNDGAISLDYWEKDGVQQYSVVIYFYTKEDIKKGGKLLMKLDNGEVIELRSGENATTQKTGVFPAMVTITFVSYPISPEQLEKVMAQNVTKIRVETALEYIDGKVYGKKFSKTISKDYELINEALKDKPSKNNDNLYDDF